MRNTKELGDKIIINMTKEMNLETSELGILWALTRELQNILIITVWYCTVYEEIRRKELMQYKVNKEIWNFGKILRN